MSIGADWRQFSPGSASGGANEAVGNKFTQSGAADQLSEDSEGRSFSEYLFGEDGFEFTDFLDVINPLQHIPGVGMIYRSLTGDELGNGARVVGGGLFGGVIGLAGAAIDAVVDAATGEDTGTHVMAFVEENFGGSGSDGLDDGTAVADASPDATLNATASDPAQENTNGYQGDLVLPWTSNVAVSPDMTAPAAEQATIVQKAPTTPVGQTVLADAGPAAIKPSDLNLPWAQNGSEARIQAQSQTRSPAEAVSPPVMENDPAELTVALASAGNTGPASTIAQSVAANSASANPVRHATLSSEGGNTVWARAERSGRVSRAASPFAISADMAAHETRMAKLANARVKEQDKAEGLAEHTDTARKTGISDMTAARPFPSRPSEVAQAPEMSDTGAAPLSAAEMAARFNAALGRDQARTMAAEATAARNSVADQGQATAGKAAQTKDDSANILAGQIGTEDVHPLMQRASSHMEQEAPVGAWFSQTMIDGLKKYQEMQKSAQTPGNSI